jgi:hypothetical protein
MVPGGCKQVKLKVKVTAAAMGEHMRMCVYIYKRYITSTSPTGAVDVEEVERLLDLFPLLRRQPLPPDFVGPVAGGVGRRRTVGGLVRARLRHTNNVQFSEREEKKWFFFLQGRRNHSAAASDPTHMYGSVPNHREQEQTGFGFATIW